MQILHHCIGMGERKVSSNLSPPILKMLQVALFKVCDANFWSCKCPKHQPWNLKKVGFPSLSPRNQKKRKFDIPHHCDESPKRLQVALAKNVCC